MKEIIEKYRKHIQQYGLSDELFKWEVLVKYQRKPSTDADKFVEDFKAIDFRNLLFYNAISVRNHLLKDRPEEYRKCLITLFDEKTPLKDRISRFDNEVLQVYRTLIPHLGHHHDERTVSTFLTFHNPEKYTLYKDSFYRKYCIYLGVKPKKKGEKYVHYLELVSDFINDYIKPDTELIELFRSKLPQGVFQDNHFMILAQDILYLTFDKKIESKANESTKKYWIYAPGENAELWDEFYENSIMALGWDSLGDLNEYESRELIQRELQQIEQTQSTKRNDTAANIDFKEKMQIGDVVFVKRGRSELLGYGIVSSDCYFDEGRDYFKNCRDVEWKTKGVWKTDHSLVLKTLTDITDYPTDKAEFRYYYETLFALMQESTEKVLNMNHPLNQILYGPPGTGKTYSTVARAYEIAKGIEVTDESYTTAKTWFKSELAKEEDRQLDFITFHQNYSYEDFVMGLKPDLRGEGLGFSEHRGVFFEICQRALTNLKDSQKPIQDIRQEKSFDEILELFKNKVLDQIETDKNGQYKITESVYIDEVTEDAFYYTGNNWNVGKRRMKFEDIKKIYNSGFTSRQEAKKTPDISGLAREHISYYFKITVELREFAQTKEKEITIQAVESVALKNYVLVIDEINRANISRVFGELITLIEDDKRWGNEHEMEVRLPDGKTKFTVPKNLHIIGTMNTADKSIALLDIALRRRFEFVGLFPNKDKVVNEYQDFFVALNYAIKAKKGVDFMIGHAYFMNKENQAFNFKSAMNTKVIPLLNEYFYNPRSTDDVKKIINDAIEVLNKTSITNKYEVAEENYQLTITEKNAGN